MPCVTRIRTSSSKTQKVAVSKDDGWRPLALREGPLSHEEDTQIKALESQRCILLKERNHSHEDHVGDREFCSWHHFNMAHALVLVSEAIKILTAKTAADRQWNKLQKLPAWSTSKDKSEQDVINEAKVNNRKVHFATVMDACHLKHSELAEHLRINKGSVVLRGETVNDDTGVYAVFTEQGSSASLMTAAKVLDSISWFLGM